MAFSLFEIHTSPGSSTTTSSLEPSRPPLDICQRSLICTLAFTCSPYSVCVAVLTTVICPLLCGTHQLIAEESTLGNHPSLDRPTHYPTRVVRCTCSTSAVLSVDALEFSRCLGCRCLSSNQLSGSFPSIGYLTDLGYLCVSASWVAALPTVTNLTIPSHRALHENQLSGAFPSFIHNLTSLYHLYVEDSHELVHLFELTLIRLSIAICMITRSAEPFLPRLALSKTWASCTVSLPDARSFVALTSHHIGGGVIGSCTTIGSRARFLQSCRRSPSSL